MMKPPRRRASRGRSVRRPAPPLSPDMDELLSLLIEVRGTPEALGVWREIREPMEHGMSWRDVEPVMRMIQRGKEERHIIDLTSGRRTKAVVVLDNDWVALLAITPETFAGRVGAMRHVDASA